jgi:predicted P-loop ATPase
MTTTLAQHDKRLPKATISPKPEKGETRPGQERCSERYMNDVLAHISADCKRNEGWLQVIAAFINATVIQADGKPLPYDEKVEMLRKWSAEGATYEDESFDETVEWYAERTDDEDCTRVGLGTVDKYARTAGYTGPGPTKSAQIFEIPKLFQAVDISGSQEIISPPEFDRTRAGFPLKSFKNAVAAVHHMAATGAKPEMDEFKGNVVFRNPVPWETNGHGRTLDDDVLLEIRLYISTKYEIDLTKEMALDAIRVVACTNRFHPVRDYLHSLEWDGISRIETWLIKYFSAEDTPYVRAVSRTWLLGAVARILTPGCKFDFMLILEGVQGLEKSTAFNILAVKDEWFTDNLQGDLHNKDAVQNLQGAWIVEMPELDGMNRSEVSMLKAFLSRKVDKIRVPWDKLPKEFPRQCVLAGTSNESAYLRDPTGGRRFWPVCVGAVDIKGLKEIRDQLWAEAVRFVAVIGERPELPREIWEAAAVEQEARRVIDPWEDELRKHVTNLDRIHSSELMRKLNIPTHSQSQNHFRRIKSIMTEQLGWKYGQVWQHGLNAQGYSKHESLGAPHEYS